MLATVVEEPRLDAEDPRVQRWAKHVQTPAIILDPVAFRRRLAFLAEHSGCTVAYAVKTNPHPVLLQEVALAEAGFDVASGGELRLLEKLGVPGKRVFFSSIAKTVEELVLARELNVRWISADSHQELLKIKRVYPEADVLLRLLIREGSAGVPLSNRFGVPPDQLQHLIRCGRELSLRIAGLSVHVGSQCMNQEAWSSAVAKLRPFLDASMSCVSLGGGFPIGYSTFGPAASMSESTSSIAAAARPLIHSGFEVLIEPGRVVAGPVGLLVASVLLVKPSVEGGQWLFLDAGAYNGLQIVCEGFDFHIQALNESGRSAKYSICGPSCHSRDVFSRPVVLPTQQPGDRLLVLNAGAYTLPFITSFCGNSPPRIEILPS
jgi:ornithine decarboxylase